MSRYILGWCVWPHFPCWGGCAGTAERCCGTSGPCEAEGCRETERNDVMEPDTTGGTVVKSRDIVPMVSRDFVLVRLHSLYAETVRKNFLLHGKTAELYRAVSR